MATLIANTNLRGTLNEGININQGRDFSDIGAGNVYGYCFIDNKDFLNISFSSGQFFLSRGHVFVKYNKVGEPFTTDPSKELHWMKCELTTNSNGFTLSGTQYIYIQVQAGLTNIGSNQVDGSDYFTIEASSTMPTVGPHIGLLYQIDATTGIVIEDYRKYRVAKYESIDATSITLPAGDIQTQINSLSEDLIDVLSQTGISYISDKSLVALEYIPINTPVYISDGTDSASSTLSYRIGDIANNSKVCIGTIGNGVSGNSIILKLSKTGSPSTNLVVRVETDNDGKPSGSLVNANATASLLPASISTSLTDTTITFPGSFTTPLGRVWIVLERGAVDINNYYNLGYANSGGSAILGSYTGTTWNTSELLYSGFSYGMQDLGGYESKTATSMSFDNTPTLTNVPDSSGVCTLQSLSGDNVVVSGEVFSDAGGSFANGSTVAGFTIKYDNNNYIRLTNRHNRQIGGSSFQYFDYTVVNGGSVVSSGSIGGAGLPVSKYLKIVKIGSSISFYSWNGSSWSILATSTSTFTGSYKVYITAWRELTSNNFNTAIINNPLITTYDYSTLSTNGISTYIGSVLFNLRGYKIARANSINTLPLDGIPRVSIAPTQAGLYLNVITEGIDTLLSGLDVSKRFIFISDSGTISTTPGTNIFPLGRIINGTTAYIGNVIYHDNNITTFNISNQSVTNITPYTGPVYLAVGDKQVDIDMSATTVVSGIVGLITTISLQYSLDNSTWSNVVSLTAVGNTTSDVTNSRTLTIPLSGGLYYRIIGNTNTNLINRISANVIFTTII